MSENECIILLYYIINMSFGQIWSQIAGKFIAMLAKVFGLVVSIHYIGDLGKFGLFGAPVFPMLPFIAE